VTFCLSKGLCAPAGSVLCGDRAFLKKAHRARKMLGGGMRQAGVLAAAGIIALQTMVSRLGEDHQRARDLADGLGKIEAVRLDPGTPVTNMLFFNLAPDANADAEVLQAKLRARGILVAPSGSRRFRFVTHYWIDDAAVDKTIEAMAELLS
jgi:threonine aldolase